MKAEELRSITHHAEADLAQVTWDRIKDKLFDLMKETAKGRGYSVNITDGHELNYNGWLDNGIIVVKFKQELEKLGFQVSYSSDRYGCSLWIKWS